MTDTSSNDTAAGEHARPADEEWARLASSLATDKSGHTPSAKGAAEPRGVHPAVLASSVALLFAFVAVMVAGMLWWQYRQFYVSLDQTDAAAAESLARVRAEQRALQDAQQDADDDIAGLRQADTAFRDRLDAMPGRFTALEERLDAVQGGSFDARGNLLRSEAEYYLTAVSKSRVSVSSVFATVR